MVKQPTCFDYKCVVLFLIEQNMRTKLFLLTLLISFFIVSEAQIVNPVKWIYSSKQVGEKTFELHITALIDDQWHLYSQDAGEDIVSTSFNFNTNPLVKLDGVVKEFGELKKTHDPNLQLSLNY